MIQVELSRIIIDEKRQDQVIVLKEKVGDRQIPIVIGFMEASSIKIKISGVDVPRPMTHDLLVSVMKGRSRPLIPVPQIVLRWPCVSKRRFLLKMKSCKNHPCRNHDIVVDALSFIVILL